MDERLVDQITLDRRSFLWLNHPMNSTFKRLVEVAKALKLTEQTGRCFHSAFLIKQGKVIGIGINRYGKTNRISATYTPTKITNIKNFVPSIHAEVDLLGKIKRIKDYSKHNVVVIRIDNQDKLSNSKPCICCHSVLEQYNIKNIYYSTQNGFEKLDI